MHRKACFRAIYEKSRDASAGHDRAVLHASILTLRGAAAIERA